MPLPPAGDGAGRSPHAHAAESALLSLIPLGKTHESRYIRLRACRPSAIGALSCASWKDGKFGLTSFWTSHGVDLEEGKADVVFSVRSSGFWSFLEVNSVRDPKCRLEG